MRIVVSAQGDTLDAPASPVFGRCPTYLFVDSDTMQFEAVPNPAMSQGGGAGIQAAQFVVERGAQAVLTGNLGPNAFDAGSSRRPATWFPRAPCAKLWKPSRPAGSGPCRLPTSALMPVWAAEQALVPAVDGERLGSRHGPWGWARHGQSAPACRGSSAGGSWRARSRVGPASRNSDRPAPAVGRDDGTDCAAGGGGLAWVLA